MHCDCAVMIWPHQGLDTLDAVNAHGEFRLHQLHLKLSISQAESSSANKRLKQQLDATAAQHR